MTPAQVRAACEGDVELRDLLFNELILPEIKLQVTKTLRRRAKRHGRDPWQDIPDFVNEAVIVLLVHKGKKLRAWDPSRGLTLGGFVKLIAHRQVLRILEGFKGNPWGGGGAAEDPFLVEQLPNSERSTFELTLSREQLEVIDDRLISGLNDRSLILFELTFVQERTAAEVAELMKTTAGAISEWKGRVRRKARRLAEDLDRPSHGSQARR